MMANSTAYNTSDKADNEYDDDIGNVHSSPLVSAAPPLARMAAMGRPQYSHSTA
ncbi:MAG TPA: hypothetical protein VM223_13790 [Planctomycetota bacterium]|nr:hypothetical protein [Planctomycetota bacterium]